MRVDNPALQRLDAVADPDRHIEGRSFDWSIHRRGPNGEDLAGPVGVTGRLNSAEEHILEAFDGFAVGTVAAARIKIAWQTNDPGTRRLVAEATLAPDGTIEWAYIPAGGQT